MLGVEPNSVYLFRHRVSYLLSFFIRLTLCVDVMVLSSPAAEDLINASITTFLNERKQIGTTGFEPASQVGGEPLVVYRQSSSIELRSEMHHIPKGASYFRIARPLRFRVSRSTGFLVTNRRRIRFTHYLLTQISGKSQVLSFRETVNSSGLTREDTSASE